MRTEIIPNSAFDGGEKSESISFPLYQAKGEDDLKVNLRGSVLMPATYPAQCKVLWKIQSGMK